MLALGIGRSALGVERLLIDASSGRQAGHNSRCFSKRGSFRGKGMAALA